MNITLAQLAEECGGRLEGSDGKDVTIDAVTNLRDATATQLSMYTDKRYATALKETNAAAILVNDALAKDFSGYKIIVDNPLLALTHVIRALTQKSELEPAGIAKTARISQTASLGENIEIGPHTVVGKHVRLGEGVKLGANVVIGDHVKLGAGTVIDANVTIYKRCELGQRCHISAGAVIGAEGFGFAETQNEAGEQHWAAIPQIGRVLIGDDVHVVANTTIDRGSLDDTVICDGVIIDNLIQIGHNVHLGRHTALAACVAIGGSAWVGANCKIGGRATINGHIKICDNVMVLAESLVLKSITEPEVFSSAMPAMPAKKWRKVVAKLRLSIR